MRRKHLLASSTSAFVVLMCAACGAESAHAQSRLSKENLKSGERLLRAFRPVVAEAARSTVRVLSVPKDKEAPRELALGAIISADGQILTKASELEKEVQCRLFDGRTLPARLVATHDHSDLALLQIEAKDLRPVAWGKPMPAVGQFLVTAAPEATPIAAGVLGVKPREIPAEAGVLGVAVTDEEKGPKVTDIVPQSGAEKAGLRKDDVIVEVASVIIKSGRALSERIGSFRPGQTLSLKVLREDKTLDVEATLGRRASELLQRGHIQNQLGGELSVRRDGFASVLQHDTVLRPEDCGGPLVDLDGAVVGLNIARAGRVETYALPVDQILPALSELQAQAKRAGGTVPVSQEPPASR